MAPRGTIWGSICIVVTLSDIETIWTKFGQNPGFSLRNSVSLTPGPTVKSTFEYIFSFSSNKYVHVFFQPLISPWGSWTARENWQCFFKIQPIFIKTQQNNNRDFPWNFSMIRIHKHRLVQIEVRTGQCVGGRQWKLACLPPSHWPLLYNLIMSL